LRFGIDGKIGVTAPGLGITVTKSKNSVILTKIPDHFDDSDLLFILALKYKILLGCCPSFLMAKFSIGKSPDNHAFSRIHPNPGIGLNAISKVPGELHLKDRIFQARTGTKDEKRRGVFPKGL
jgi:hypothetical protein